MNVLKKNFLSKLNEITNLSKKVNENYKEKFFQMIKEHSIEIEELYKNNDSHWTVETGDLIVLCFELLISENIDIDNNFERCLPRFYNKLSINE